MSAQRPVSIERVNFYDELAKRRKRGRIYLAASLIVASSFGVVIGMVITPILILLWGGLLKLALLLGIGGELARAGVAAIRGLIAYDHFGPAVVLKVAVISLLVGGLVWWSLRSMFLRAARFDLIRHLGARPARGDDLEERQLLNIVEEVAIGSGAPAPKLFVIDTPTINATALGHGPENAVLVVTRGLLDRLDRDETEAIVARLVTGLAAGDLNVISGIMATFHTFFLFLTVLDLFRRPSAWRTLGRLARVIATPRPGAEAVASVAFSLEETMEEDEKNIYPYIAAVRRMLPRADRLRVAIAKHRVLFALLWVATIVVVYGSLLTGHLWFLNLFLFLWGGVMLYMIVVVGILLYKMLMFLWSFFFFNLPMRGLWRNRCFWSDAQTVKLTRRPDAFASALQQIGEPPPGAEAYAWLLIDPSTRSEKTEPSKLGSLIKLLALPPKIQARVDRLMAMGGGLPRTTPGILSWAARNPILGGFLAVLLVPLFTTLFGFLLGAILFLAGMVMTYGLMIGLALVELLI